MTTHILNYLRAKDFWELVVLPDAREFLRSRSDLRAALHAAMSVYHLTEWVWRDTNLDVDQRTSGDFKAFENRIMDACPSMKILRDIGLVAKHRGLDNNRRVVENLAVTKWKGGASGWRIGSGGYGVGLLGYASGTPEFAARSGTQDGTTISWLSDDFRTAVKYWHNSHFQYTPESDVKFLDDWG